jgi:hypothetical protein
MANREEVGGRGDSRKLTGTVRAKTTGWPLMMRVSSVWRFNRESQNTSLSRATVEDTEQDDDEQLSDEEVESEGVSRTASGIRLNHL